MAQIPFLSFYPLSTFPPSSPSFPLILLPQSLTATSDASLPPEPKLPLPPHPSLPSSSQMGHPPNKSPNKVRVFASTWNMGGGWAEKELECALQRTGRQKREKGGNKEASCCIMEMKTSRLTRLRSEQSRCQAQRRARWRRGEGKGGRAGGRSHGCSRSGFLWAMTYTYVDREEGRERRKEGGRKYRGR